MTIENIKKHSQACISHFHKFQYELLIDTTLIDSDKIKILVMVNEVLEKQIKDNKKSLDYYKECLKNE